MLMPVNDVILLQIEICQVLGFDRLNSEFALDQFMAAENVRFLDSAAAVLHHSIDLRLTNFKLAVQESLSLSVATGLLSDIIGGSVFEHENRSPCPNTDR
jgi:hypothetical protein